MSAIYTIGAALIGFFLGLGLALLLHREFRFRRLARILVLLPWPVPSAIAGLIWIWFFDQNFGVLNHVLSSLGLVRTPVPWLNSANYALAALIATTVWKTYPFYTLMMLAGLQSIPQELYEAGDIDGASLLQRFWYITLPALRTVMAIALVLQILWAFGHVDIIKVMTNGGPSRGTETLSMFIYKEAFQFFDFGQAAVAGMMSLVISVLVVSVILPVVSKEFF